jgi:hypothetical protein
MSAQSRAANALESRVCIAHSTRYKHFLIQRVADYCRGFVICRRSWCTASTGVEERAFNGKRKQVKEDSVIRVG